MKIAFVLANICIGITIRNVCALQELGTYELSNSMEDCSSTFLMSTSQISLKMVPDSTSYSWFGNTTIKCVRIYPESRDCTAIVGVIYGGLGQNFIQLEFDLYNYNIFNYCYYNVQIFTVAAACDEATTHAAIAAAN
ncbi:uncharacterized protein LOC130898648 [Diorhabda carinulata]|uniref:uncharacterized protein LOC130898648 n=1 Tax=Diorhabda carinulata TaxID=1163345 RepID=UPI0025A1950A|nr:uncharacterized protein LOC130898648 [Diorhabda carinulata]